MKMDYIVKIISPENNDGDPALSSRFLYTLESTLTILGLKATCESKSLEDCLTESREYTLNGNPNLYIVDESIVIKSPETFKAIQTNVVKGKSRICIVSQNPEEWRGNFVISPEIPQSVLKPFIKRLAFGVMPGASSFFMDDKHHVVSQVIYNDNQMGTATDNLVNHYKKLFPDSASNLFRLRLTIDGILTKAFNECSDKIRHCMFEVSFNSDLIVCSVKYTTKSGKNIYSNDVREILNILSPAYICNMIVERDQKEEIYLLPANEDANKKCHALGIEAISNQKLENSKHLLNNYNPKISSIKNFSSMDKIDSGAVGSPDKSSIENLEKEIENQSREIKKLKSEVEVYKKKLAAEQKANEQKIQALKFAQNSKKAG